MDDLTSGWQRSAPHLSESRWTRHVHVVAVTMSTNDDAKNAATLGAPAGTTFVAEEQRAGRGRQGRSWHAPAGSALLASIIARPRLAPSALPPLSLAVGLAVADVLAPRVTTGRVQVKWPNDVLIDGQKTAGILVESSCSATAVAWTVIGIGINVRRASLPDDIATLATSLEAAGATESALHRGVLLSGLLDALEHRVGTLETQGLAALLDDLRARDGAYGRPVTGDQISGVAAGIDDEGRLLVQQESGELVSVSSGAVHFSESWRIKG